jgi:predicted hotdog family 3-hydroxylacyl-ACP dehydratase
MDDMDNDDNDCGMKGSVPIEGDELIKLLPHRGKMFLLSRIVSFDLDKHSLVSEYDISGDSLFFDKTLGGFPSWAAFELAAQSISALSGLRGRLRGEGPKFGFILSVSALEVRIPVLKEGVPVSVTVEEETVLENVYSFRCGVYSGGKNAVSAKLTVMEADDPEAVLRSAGA